MNRNDLVTRVAETARLEKKTVEQVLLATLEQIMQALRRSEEVSLVGFGQFSASSRRSRRGVNPRNPREEIRIPAVKVVRFQAGKRLKEAVRGGNQTVG